MDEVAPDEPEPGNDRDGSDCLYQGMARRWPEHRSHAIFSHVKLQHMQRFNTHYVSGIAACIDSNFACLSKRVDQRRVGINQCRGTM
jgi:hypothetical protein